MEKQINKKAYDFKKYCQAERWSSYWLQINEILKCSPQNILEIGIGDKVLAGYLRNNTDINYSSLDIAQDLKPDIVGSIENIPLADNSFDLVCAFEVLEHLPFEKLEKTLSELYRVSRKNVIISLPHWGRHFSIDMRLPFFKRVRCQYKLNLFPIKHRFDGQHYWEIGKRGYCLKRIKKEIESMGLKVIKDYIAFESPYHHFFILEKT